MSGIDIPRSQVLNRRWSEQVVSDTRDHGNFGAAQPGGDGLIGPFTAEAEIEVLPEDGLAGTREIIREGGQIDIRASDDDDVRRLVRRSVENFTGRRRAAARLSRRPK